MATYLVTHELVKLTSCCQRIKVTSQYRLLATQTSVNIFDGSKMIPTRTHTHTHTHIYKLKRCCPSYKPDSCLSMNMQTLQVLQVIIANHLNRQGIRT